MIIQSVKLENIRSYIDETINFPTGSVMLSGDIGCGKSTILLSIEFALFGIIRGSVDGQSLLRNGKNQGSVLLSFDLDGKKINVFRVLKRTKNGITQEAGYLEIDSLRTQCTPIELKSKVLELLGYPKELITKSKALIYRYTVYTPQEEMKHILFEDAQSRLDTLRKVFRIDKYKTIKENSKLAISQIRSQSKVLEAKYEDLEQKKANSSQFNEQKNNFVKELNELDPKIKKCSLEIEKLKEEIGKFEQDSKKSNEINLKISSLESQLSQKVSQISSLNQEQQKINAEIESLKNKSVSIEQKKEFGGYVFALKEKLQKLTDQVTQKNFVEEKIKALQAQIDLTTKKLNEQEIIIKNAESIKEKISSLSNCPLCYQEVDDTHKHKVIGSQESEKANATKQIDLNFQNLEKLKQESEILDKQLSEIRSKEVLVNQLNSWVPVFSQTAQNFDIGMSEFEFQDDVFSKAQKLNEQINSFSSTNSVILEKKKLLQSNEEKIVQTKKEVGQINSQKIALQDERSKFAHVEDKIKSLRSELDELLAKDKALEVKKNTIQTSIQNIDFNLESLAKEIALKQSAKVKNASLVDLNNWLDSYFVNVVGTIEKQVFLKLHKEFSQIFNEWFNMLIEEESINVRLDDSFSPIVEMDGYDLALNNLSGGEKTSCALAYRLALNRVINDMMTTIRTKDLLILDEPTDGFSSEQLERVREVLYQLNIKQIIIVSHEAKLESFVDNVIRVQKVDGASRLL